MSACLAVGVTVFAAQDERKKDAKDGERRPKAVLRASPRVSMSPSRVKLTAELQGGAKDFEEYYCPTVEWIWGDGTASESTSDCEPFEAGKSEIKRQFRVEHVFRLPGTYQVVFRLKRQDKTLLSVGTQVQVSPGAGPPQ